MDDRAIPTEVSAVKREGSREANGCSDDSVNGDCQTLSPPAKWTEEKHNLYLNSMESSFVNQLYDKENASSDLLGCLPLGTPKPMKLGSTSNFCHFSCQFESFGTTSHDFMRKRKTYELKNETRQLFENPRVPRFTSRYSSNQVDSNGRLINRAMPSLNTSTTDSSHMPSQHHAANITEGSDQNFDDTDSDGEREEQVAERKKSHTAEPLGEDKKP